MAYKTDKLNHFAELKKKREERLNVLQNEINEAEKVISDKEKQYQQALSEDKDDNAVQLLDEIAKLRNDITIRIDKSKMLNTGEAAVRNERAAAAMVEYKENKKEFDKAVSKKEQELNKIKEQYIAKVHEIVKFSKEFQKLNMRYSGIPVSVGDKQNKILFNQNQTIQAGKYRIENFSGGNQ